MERKNTEGGEGQVGCHKAFEAQSDALDLLRCSYVSLCPDILMEARLPPRAVERLQSEHMSKTLYQRREREVS